MGRIITFVDNPQLATLRFVPVKEMIVDADADRKRLGGRAEFANRSLINSEKKSEKICFEVNSMETHEYITFDQSGPVVFRRVVDCKILLEINSWKSKQYQNIKGLNALMVIRSIKRWIRGQGNDHGFKPYKALMGAVANQNKMRLSFDISTEINQHCTSLVHSTPRYSTPYSSIDP